MRPTPTNPIFSAIVIAFLIVLVEWRDAATTSRPVAVRNLSGDSKQMHGPEHAFSPAEIQKPGTRELQLPNSHCAIPGVPNRSRLRQAGAFGTFFSGRDWCGLFM